MPRFSKLDFDFLGLAQPVDLPATGLKGIQFTPVSLVPDPIVPRTVDISDSLQAGSVTRDVFVFSPSGGPASTSGQISASGAGGSSAFVSASSFSGPDGSSASAFLSAQGDRTGGTLEASAGSVFHNVDIAGPTPVDQTFDF